MEIVSHTISNQLLPDNPPKSRATILRKILDVSMDMPQIFLFISPRDLGGYQKELIRDGIRSGDGVIILS